MAFLKTPLEKLETKLKKIEEVQGIKREGNKYIYGETILVEYTENEIRYGKSRFSKRGEEKIYEAPFSVIIRLNHENLKLLNSFPLNPPLKTKVIASLFAQLSNAEIDCITVGSESNELDGENVFLKKETYDSIGKIDTEEGREKAVRVRNRSIPFLLDFKDLNLNEIEVERDYSLLLKEVVASGQFSQNDIINFTQQLEAGESTKVVIEKHIYKQVEWLIDSIENILEEDNLTKPKAKDLGKKLFGYNKISISGPEELMEKILTEYGQYSLFGVPALINTNKYVVHDGVSRSQFDLVLINHLGDVEIVELKRPDNYLFDYDSNRGKFYPTKDLAIAIAQTERYITTIMKDNDEEYLIEEKKLRDYLNNKIGNDIFIEAIRPTGIILMGSWEKLTKAYDKIPLKKKASISKEQFEADGFQAYKELKNSLKNIKILTYSELLENSRTRFETTD